MAFSIPLCKNLWGPLWFDLIKPLNLVHKEGEEEWGGGVFAKDPPSGRKGIVFLQLSQVVGSDNVNVNTAGDFRP